MAYIVKNCPCYQEAMYTFDAVTGEKKLTEKHVCISPNHGGYCLKCSDCVIKKVIDTCKDEAMNCDEQFECSECFVDTTCGSEFANNLLKKFDIEDKD